MSRSKRLTLQRVRKSIKTQGLMMSRLERKRQMDLFDKVEGALAGILPGGKVRVHFSASDDGTPEQKGAAAALNDFPEYEEDCIVGLCKTTGLTCNVLGEDGTTIRLYTPDGEVESISDFE